MPLPPTTAISQEDTNAGDNQENITTNARDKQENITMTDAGVYVNVCVCVCGHAVTHVRRHCLLLKHARMRMHRPFLQPFRRHTHSPSLSLHLSLFDPSFSDMSLALICTGEIRGCCAACQKPVTTAMPRTAVEGVRPPVRPQAELCPAPLCVCVRVRG
jgi:hypothetical protein